MLPGVDSERLREQIEALAAFDSEPSRPGTTRVLLSDAEIEARRYVKALMEEAGLEVREDAAANIYGILRGSDPALTPVWSGSHIDTVICAGKYDGMIGVLGAIEACRVIRQNRIPHRRDIVALVYSSEEPTRFGVGCIGSRALAGHLTVEEMKKLTDDGGTTLYELLRSRGYDAEAVPALKKEQGEVFASVELHIEQAAVLEEKKIPIGIVTGICAPTYMHVTVKGVQEHAGATPMAIRKDALCAAAEIVLELERLARALGHPNAVATVGKMNVSPNASNVIPGCVDFSIDIRDYLAGRKEQLAGDICRAMDRIAEERGVVVEYELLASDVPCISDGGVVAAIEEVCREREIPFHEMISGAYHDSMFVAEFAPVGMIFVPSRNGISHDPAEFTSHEDIVRGVQVLAEALERLADMD